MGVGRSNAFSFQLSAISNQQTRNRINGDAEGGREGKKQRKGRKEEASVHEKERKEEGKKRERKRRTKGC